MGFTLEVGGGLEVVEVSERVEVELNVVMTVVVAPPLLLEGVEVEVETILELDELLAVLPIDYHCPCMIPKKTY